MTIQAVVFDVNETLFPLTPLRDRFDRTGLGSESVERWFAEILRDGFAVAAADGFVPFPAVARHHLLHLARQRGFTDAERVADEVLGGFEEVGAHHDVIDGMRSLREAGYRLATFTNGTVEVTRGFLERTGIEDLVDEVLDVSGTAALEAAAGGLPVGLRHDRGPDARGRDGRGAPVGRPRGAAGGHDRLLPRPRRRGLAVLPPRPRRDRPPVSPPWRPASVPEGS